MNENKLLLIIEIVLIIGGLLFFTIKEAVPEYKSNYGSSDKFISTNNYSNLIEISIDNKTNFGLVLNKEQRIYNIMFFDKTSICLYNQNIENKELSKSLDQIVTLLIENNYLKVNSNIIITKYNDKNYNEFIEKLANITTIYNLKLNINEKTSNLKDKAKELEIVGSNDEEILQNLDYYSKQLVSNIKNNISKDNNDKEETVVLSKTNSRTLSDNVYKKIENYIIDNNISNLDKDNDKLLITLIPADTSNKYYPTSNSWYYIKDKKVYAYIELNEAGNYYRYCYKGSIDDIKEGAC